IGVGFNQAYKFMNSPKIFAAVQTPNFVQHTETAFTYTVGAGIEREISKHWQTGIGYEFSDWGASRLSRAYGQTLNSGLSLNHLYTNGFLLNVTYVA
ncbi:MAG: porin family protein, partial [Legionellaceae bacterium]|nr:porin family protein [Legionellaceae bacterium]